jgi:predicted DNA-binding ribbon-helix-helix protein
MLVKYSFHIGEREATVSMEQEFWNALRDIAADRDMTLSALLKEVVDEAGGDLGHRRLSSILRVYILEQLMPEGMAARSASGRRHVGTALGKSSKRREPPS